jgi:hypothetical protein
MFNRVRGAAVIAAALAFGCGGSDSGGASTGMINPSGGDSSSAGSSSNSCLAGEACDCGSGLTSFTVCDAQGRQSCDCGSCPPFVVSKSGFKSCGGADGVAAALYGTWVLQSNDVSEIKGSFKYTGVDGTSSALCDSVVHQSSTPSMTLILREAGNASVHKLEDNITYSVVHSCLAQLPDCSSFKTCRTGACGLCVCSDNLGDVSDDAATWSTADASLSLTENKTLKLTFDYCLAGEQLTLQDTVSKEVLVLTRTAQLGKPTACETRSTKRCESDGSCQLGACVGPGCLADDKNCNNEPGCSFDSKACTGTPKAECETADYGVVPGCGQSATPGCTGNPQPCSASNAASGATAADCAARVGCEPLPSCTGTSTAQCDESVVACNECAPGCACTFESPNYRCSGMTTCADEKTSSACLGVSCKWLDFDGCGGTPPSCESLSVDTCSSSPGCTLG